MTEIFYAFCTRHVFRMCMYERERNKLRLWCVASIGSTQPPAHKHTRKNRIRAITNSIVKNVLSIRPSEWVRERGRERICLFLLFPQSPNSNSSLWTLESVYTLHQYVCGCYFIRFAVRVLCAIILDYESNLCCRTISGWKFLFHSSKSNNLNNVFASQL